MKNDRKVSDLTQDERNEILEWFKEGKNVLEIAVAYRLKSATGIYTMARIAGLPPRGSALKPLSERKSTKGLSKERVEVELLAAEQHVVDLKRKLAGLQLRVEVNPTQPENSFIVYGVDRNFRLNEGMAKIVQFVCHHWPQAGPK